MLMLTRAGRLQQPWAERFSIHTSCCNEGIDPIICDCHLIVLQFEDQKIQTASEMNALIQANAGLVATRPGASCWMTRGPHPKAAIPSLGSY